MYRVYWKPKRRFSFLCDTLGAVWIEAKLVKCSHFWSLMSSFRRFCTDEPIASAKRTRLWFLSWRMTSLTGGSAFTWQDWSCSLCSISRFCASEAIRAPRRRWQEWRPQSDAAFEPDLIMRTCCRKIQEVSVQTFKINTVLEFFFLLILSFKNRRLESP